MKGPSVLPLLTEFAVASRTGGFVPYACDKNVGVLVGVVSGIHHGLSLGGLRDESWNEFSAWLRQTGLAQGTESPLDILVRLSPDKPLELIADWIDEFEKREK